MSQSTAVRRNSAVLPSRPSRVGGLLLATGLVAAGLLVASPFGGTASASADEGAPGTFTISASATSIAPGDRAFINVHRSGGTDGIVSVSVDSAALPAELVAVIAPIDTEVIFLDGDAADKTVPIVFLGEDRSGDQPGDAVPGGHETDAEVPDADVPDADVPDAEVPDADVPDDDGDDDDIRDDAGTDDTKVIEVPSLAGGTAHAATSLVAAGAVSRALAAADGPSAPLTVSLSAPTGGAGLGTPSSVSISVATPPTTTPVDGGSGTPGETTGGTTTPGASSNNSSGTTTPVGGGQSLADTGVNAILPFIVAMLAAIAGLAALLVMRRRRAAPTE